MKKTIDRLLSIKGTPLILAGLLAVLTWLANGIVAREMDTPILEQTKEWNPEELPATFRKQAAMTECAGADKKTSTKYNLLYTMRNLSHANRLEAMTFFFRFEQKVNILRIADRAIPPHVSSKQAPYCHVKIAKIGPVTMQPGGTIQFLLEIDTQVFPLLQAESDRSSFRLVEADLRTWIMRYYTPLALISAVLFSSLIILYLYLLASHQTADVHRSTK